MYCGTLRTLVVAPSLQEDVSSLGKLILQDSFVVWNVQKNMLKNITKLRGKNRQVFLYEKAIIFTRKEPREFEDGKEEVVYQFKSLVKVSRVLRRFSWFWIFIKVVDMRWCNDWRSLCDCLRACFSRSFGRRLRPLDAVKAGLHTQIFLCYSMQLVAEEWGEKKLHVLTALRLVATFILQPAVTNCATCSGSRSYFPIELHEVAGNWPMKILQNIMWLEHQRQRIELAFFSLCCDPWRKMANF